MDKQSIFLNNILGEIFTDEFEVDESKKQEENNHKDILSLDEIFGTLAGIERSFNPNDENNLNIYDSKEGYVNLHERENKEEAETLELNNIFGLFSEDKVGIDVSRNNKKPIYLDNGVLEKDFSLNNNMVIEKGESYKKIEDGGSVVTVEFSRITSIYEGIKIYSENPKIPMAREVFEEFANIDKPKYLNRLESLTEKDIKAKSVLLEDGIVISYVTKREVVRRILDTYNVYSYDDVTIEDVVEGNLQPNPRLIVGAMVRLGYVAIKNGEIFVK